MPRVIFCLGFVSPGFLPTAPDSAPFGCAIVMAARDGRVLVGNNEDRNHLKTIVTFIPASGHYYGRIVFGDDDDFVQGGMNDQGLFVDGNALAPTGWKSDPDKPTFSGIVMMVILGTCSTCEDVEAFFEKFNVPALERARFPVADRTGASMVVEYGRSGVQFVRSGAWYQIATNFVMSNVNDGNYPGWRYRTADRILSDAQELNEDVVRDILDKTHQEGNSLTVYSNIYDLRQSTIRVYNLPEFRGSRGDEPRWGTEEGPETSRSSLSFRFQAASPSSQKQGRTAGRRSVVPEFFHPTAG